MADEKYTEGVDPIPYRKKIYTFLTDNFSDFKRSESEFNSKLDSDPEYAGSVYNVIADNFSDFKRPKDEFLSLIGPPKKKDLFGSVTTYAGQLAKGAGKVLGTVRQGLEEVAKVAGPKEPVLRTAGEVPAEIPKQEPEPLFKPSVPAMAAESTAPKVLPRELARTYESTVKEKKVKDLTSAIGVAKSVEEAALNFALNQDTQKAKRYSEGNTFSPKVMGKMVFDFINDPDTEKLIANNPQLQQQINETAQQFFDKYPDYGAVIVGNKVSRGYEKQKDWYENIGIPAAFVKDDLDKFAKSSLEPKEYEIYSKYIKGKEEDYIDTPSLLEGVASGAKGVYKGFYRTFTEPFVSGTESDKRKWEEEASNVSADPEGLSKFMSGTGHVIGLVGALGGPSSLLTGAGLSANAANSINVGTAFFGDQLKTAKEKFPNSPVKYTTDAILNTGMFMALGRDIFPSDKVAAALKGVQPEVSKVVENLANGAITREAARQEATNIYKSVFDVLSKGLKQNVKVSAELTGIAALNKTLDKVMGLDQKKFDEYHPKDEEAKTFISMFLDNAVISGVAGYGAIKGRNNFAQESYYDAATNPQRYKKIIADIKEENPNVKTEEMLSNLDFLVQTKKSLDARGMSPENQKKYLTSAVKSKVLYEQFKAEKDDVLKKQKEQELAELTKEKEDILSGVAPEVEVKEEEVEGPAIEGEVSEETLNKYLSTYKRQLSQRRKELTEQGVKDIEADEQLKGIQDKIANVEGKLSKLAGLKPGEVAPENAELNTIRDRINKINAAGENGKLLEDSYPGELKELKQREQDILSKSKPAGEVAPEVPATPKKDAKADIERRRQEELKERVVYDRFPTVEDGEFKIIGDPNNKTFRINENTGRVQVLDESSGLWSNDALPPKIFMSTAAKSGFQKTKDAINAKYDAELAALEAGKVSPEVPATEITEQEYTDFIDKGIVTPERLNDIAQKVKNQEKLSEREQEIFTDKTADINKIIAGEVKPEVPEVENVELNNIRQRINKINAARENGKLLEDSYPGELKELKQREQDILSKAKPQVTTATPVPSIIEVKSPKEVKQGDTVLWRGEEFVVDEVNNKGGFNLRNAKEPTWTVKDARITDEEFQGKRGEAVPEAKLEVETAPEVPVAAPVPAKPTIVPREVQEPIVKRISKSIQRIFGKKESQIATLSGKEWEDALAAAKEGQDVNFQSWGAFEKTGFEETPEYKKLLSEGKIREAFDIKNIAGKPVVVINPDNMMTGVIISKDGKPIINGNGGINFVSKFGDVWASSDQATATTLAKYINEARELDLKNGGDGVVQIVVTKGTLAKSLTSQTGAKGAMAVLENLVDKGLIGLKDFRKALTDVGKKYGIDFDGRADAKSIHSDIASKFFGVDDSSFSRRGTFIEDVINHLSENSESVHNNIEGIRDALNSKELISEETGKPRKINFAKAGVIDALGLLFSDNMTKGVPSSHAYATIEVSKPVKVEKGEHESYPFHIRQEDGSRPTLNILSDKRHVTEIVNDKNNAPVLKNIPKVDAEGKPILNKNGVQLTESGAGKLGSNQIGMAKGFIKSESELPKNDVQYMTNSKGEVYGFEKNGNIFLNGDYVTPNTPIHEAGHIWTNWAEQNRGDLFNTGLSKIEGSRYLKDVESNPFYQEQASKLPEDQRQNYFRKEALAKAIGDNGEKFVTEAKKNDFKQWVLNLWRNVIREFGIRDMSAEQLSKLTIDEFSKKVAADIFGGKPEQQLKTEGYAVQEQAAGEVPVQPKAGVSKKVEGGVPGAKPKEAPKEAKAEGKEEVTSGRSKAFLNAIINATGTPEAAKEGMRSEGLRYKPSSQKEARELANSIVEEMGIDEAVNIATKKELHDGDVNAFIMGRALEKLADLEAAATSPKEKQQYAERFAEIAIAQDEMARSGGRFNAAIGDFYKKSPLGVVIYENAKRQDNFTDWSRNKEESWKDFYARLMEEPEFSEIVGEEVSQKVKSERAQERVVKKEKAHKAIDGGIAKVKDFIKKNLSAQLPEGTKKAGGSIDIDKILDAAGKVMKKAYDAGETVREAVQKAIDYISAQVGNKDWGIDEFRKSAEESLGKVEGKAAISPEQAKQKVLDRLRGKLNGLSEKEKAEVVRNSFSKIVESGGLNYDDFKAIIAKVTGRGELTTEEAAKIKELVNKTNAVEEAAKRAQELRTPKAVKEYRIVQLEAAKAAAELNEMLDTKVNISERISALIQLNTLGAITLLNNPLVNAINQMGVRFPVHTFISLVDKGVGAAAKAVGGKYETDPSLLSLQAQKEYFKNLGLGFKEAGGQLWTGLNRQDYTQKELTTQRIRPLEAWKALFNISRGKQKASTAQIIDKTLQALPGVPAEVVARTLNLGDKPFRFGTEAAWGSAFAKELGLKDIDYNLFLEFPREEAYRAYKKQGLSDKEAAQKADYIKDVIVKEGKKATFTQDNILNDLISSLFQNKAFKGTGGLVKTLTVSPYIKVPVNAWWSYYNLLNPEVAMLQAIYYGGKSVKQTGNEKKMSLRDARYWFGHAAVGIATKAVIYSLVQAGIVNPGSDEEETKKEREGKRQYVQPGTINIDKLLAFANGENPDDVKRGLEIPLKFFGSFGQLANAQGKQYEEMTPEQRQAKREYWDYILGKMELEGLKELKDGIFANSSALLAGINNGDLDLRRYGTSIINLATNIVQPATFAQISRAELPYQSTAKADDFLTEIKNNMLQRSSMFRKLAKEMPPAKIGLWGDVLTKEGGTAQKILGVSKANDDAFAAPVWELYKKTGDDGYFPSAILPVLGENKLNVEQTTKLQQYVGEARKNRIAPVVNDEADLFGYGVKFSELDDADKKMVLSYLYQLSKDAGAERLYKEYPELAPKEKEVDIMKKIQKKLFMSLEKYR